MLFSSHVLSEVEQVCDRVAILRSGRLVHVQTLAELREGRLVRARLSDPWDGNAPLPEGLRLREYEKDILTLEYHGLLPELLAWLARQPLADLQN